MVPVVTIIQARMSSSRLPGKVLMPLGDGLVLDHVLRRAAPFSTQCVVCTSTDPSDDPIERFCQDRDVLCVRGPLDDVFVRYRQTLGDPGLSPSPWFARVTADCPLLSTDLALAVLNGLDADSDDYACVVHDALPRGLAAEFIRTATFLAIDPDTLDGPGREHVTLHLYEHPDLYRCRFVEPPVELQHPALRLTLDYPEDYALLTTLFEADPTLSAEQAIVRLLESSELQRVNAHCVQKAARPSGVEPPLRGHLETSSPSIPASTVRDRFGR